MKYFANFLICLFGLFLYSPKSYSQINFEYSSLPLQYIKKINFQFEEIDKKAIDLTSLLPKNYKRDGSVDYTEYIQKGLDDYSIVLMPDFPILINDNGLNVQSNCSIYFNRNSKLIMKASSKGTDSNLDVYQVLLLDKVSNVKIYNANIEGDRYTHKGTKGEWGHGINIRSSTNIFIKNAKIRNFWGDGLCIGRNKRSKNKEGFYIPCNDIRIVSSIIDNNRRNGISLTCGINVNINNVLLANQNGTLPMSGLDIEPNLPFDAIDNINIKNIYTYNNAQDGILLVLTRLTSKSFVNTCNISIYNHIDDHSYAAFRLGSGFPKGNEPLKGNVIISNATWINSIGLRYRNGYEQLPKTTFKNIVLKNPKVLKRSEKYNATGDSKKFDKLTKIEKNIFVK